MAVNTQQVSVGTTASRIAGVASAGGATPQGSCIIRNRGTAPVFLGGSNVTTGNGFQLDPGESFTSDFRLTDELYALSASGTVPCHVVQVGGN